MLRAATAIGAGIGVLGFVAFFGGAIFFTRFVAAGLPAEEAIAHVPRDHLIATGAAFLVPAFFTALAAVTALVVLDSMLGRRGNFRRDAEDALTAARQRLEDREAERAAALAKLAPPSAPPASTGATTPPPPAPPTTEELEGLERQVEEARGAVRRAEDHCADKKKVGVRRVLVGLVLVVCEFLIVLPALDGMDALKDWVLVGVAAVLTVAASIVVLYKTSFTWFALASFLGVAVFVAVAAYERTKNDTKMSPVALIHDHNQPAYGFFVTETSDRVYIAYPQRKVHAKTLKLADTSDRLLEFKRAAVTNLEIGPLVRSERAYRRSLELAREICTVPKLPKKQSHGPAKPVKRREKSKLATDRDKRAAAALAKKKTKKTAQPCDPARFAAIKTELHHVQNLDRVASRARRVLSG